MAFSLSAIVTSFLGFVVALTDFFADLLDGGEAAGSAPESLGAKARDFALTLGPPVLVACWDPSLFFQAIDKAAWSEHPFCGLGFGVHSKRTMGAPSFQLRPVPLEFQRSLDCFLL